MTKITDLESEFKGYREVVEGQPKVTTTKLHCDDLGLPNSRFVSESSAACERNNIPKQDTRFQPTNRDGMMFGTRSNGNGEYFLVHEDGLQPETGMRSYGAEYKLRKLKMPIFEGEDVYGWIYRMERYFHIQGLEARDQLTAAELCLEGQALSWYRWSRLVGGQLVGVPETILEGTFIKGLKQDLRVVVNVLHPHGLSHAMKLAVSIKENKLFGNASQEKRSKGSCFKCDEKYGPGHQCKSKSQVLWVDEEDAYQEMNPLKRGILICGLCRNLVSVKSIARSIRHEKYSFLVEMKQMEEGKLIGHDPGEIITNLISTRTSKWISGIFDEFHGGAIGGHVVVLKTYKRMAVILGWNEITAQDLSLMQGGLRELSDRSTRREVYLRPADILAFGWVGGNMLVWILLECPLLLGSGTMGLLQDKLR
nr:ankyrin repeat-containing protein [Tanacetum cinerariifolium]